MGLPPGSTMSTDCTVACCARDGIRYVAVPLTTAVSLDTSQ